MRFRLEDELENIHACVFSQNSILVTASPVPGVEKIEVE